MLRRLPAPCCAAGDGRRPRELERGATSRVERRATHGSGPPARAGPRGRGSTSARPCTPRRRRSHRRGASGRAPPIVDPDLAAACPSLGRRSVRALGQDDREAPDAGPPRGGRGRPDRRERGQRAGRRTPGRSGAFGAQSVHRPASGGGGGPVTMELAPCSHSLSACQWISPMVFWVTSGWRTRSRARPIVSGRRRRSRLVGSTGHRPGFVH